MEVEGTGTSVGKAKPATAKKRERAPRKENSIEFQEIQSHFLQLSVAEKQRMVKQLAGQIGLVALGPDQIGRLGAPATARAPAVRRTQGPPVTPSPWKNLPEQKAVELAYANLRVAKEGNGGKELPNDHAAAKAYKDSLDKLKAKKALVKAESASAKRARTG